MFGVRRGDDAHASAPCPELANDDFAQRYQDLFRRSLRVAYRMTRDAARSEDFAAEAMARAYARWGTVRKLDQPEAWVLRVTVNLVVDHARRAKLVRATLPLLAETSVRPSFDDDVAVRAALVAALGTLPRRQRETIALRYLAELDEDEISRSLQISPSSVRTHVQRGLATLRDRMGTPFEGVPVVAS